MRKQFSVNAECKPADHLLSEKRGRIRVESFSAAVITVLANFFNGLTSKPLKISETPPGRHRKSKVLSRETFRRTMTMYNVTVIKMD